MTAASPALDEPRRRLHPLSPVLKSAKSLAVIVAAISWRGFSELGLTRWVVAVIVVLAGSVVVSVMSWRQTGYHVVGRELRVHEGVLWRRTRAIPLERLQAVEVVQPLLARLTGLAELRLEVMGAAKTEAPLAYLAFEEAAALRVRLLTLAGRAPAEPAAADVAGGAAPARPSPRLIHTVANGDVLVSQLLTPQLWFVPFALAFLVAQFVSGHSWGFVAVASTITAIAGVILQPARRVQEDWHFRISRDDAGLHLRRGLVETRSQTVPLDRVQAIGITWPLLWRPKRWLRCRIDVAGFASPEREEGGKSDRLLPVGDLRTARSVVLEVLPEVDLLTLGLTPPPPRARWLAPLRRSVLASGLTDQAFATRDGLLTRHLVIVPFARIQSVRIVQGPLQRRLGLATVHADTAGALHALAEHRDLVAARALAAELIERARAARSAG